jgi:hypothetical protein
MFHRGACAGWKITRRRGSPVSSARSCTSVSYEHDPKASSTTIYGRTGVSATDRSHCHFNDAAELSAQAVNFLSFSGSLLLNHSSRSGVSSIPKPLGRSSTVCIVLNRWVSAFFARSLSSSIMLSSHTAPPLGEGRHHVVLLSTRLAIHMP